MHDLSDKQLKIIRERCELGLQLGARKPPTDVISCFAYLATSMMAMHIDVELARRAERAANPPQQKQER